MFSALVDHIRSILPVSEKEIELIRPFLSVKKFEKGSYLVRENVPCDTIAFITHGYFRIYINTEMEEVTIHLSGAGNFITALSAFITRTPSRESVQALTEAEAILINYEGLQALYQKSHTIERLGRLMTEKHFVDKEQRVISLITDNAEQRYRDLMERHPDYILNIPLQYIASCLGVKPETLSRIRAKI